MAIGRGRVKLDTHEAATDDRCLDVPFLMAYDALMRTTLTIDDRIAKALKELAHRSDRPFKDVVNETLRAGLKAEGSRKAKPYVVRPAALGGPMPGINLNKVLALSDAIEDQELAAKTLLRK